MQPLVSIIIPVYNSSAFIKKSVENLLQQTYQAIEIILIDDGSTDDSFQIAKTFESGKIKVITQANSGAAVARNTGLAAASGDFIQFMDVDDFLSPDKIEKQVQALTQFPDQVAVCNYINFVNNNELENAMPADQSSFIFSSDNPANFLLNLWGANGESEFIQTNCWLVPRHLIEKAGDWRKYRCPDDDGEFFTRVLLAGKGIVYVPGVINYYRRENTIHKLSTSPARKYLMNTLLTIDLKYRYIEKKAPKNILRKAFAKQYLDFAIYNYPRQKALSKIALKRYKTMKTKAQVPLLGGIVIEMVKNIFGWKFAIKVKTMFSF